jgi:hypothetical protein
LSGRPALDHPAELVLRVPRHNLGEAREFCADLELALSELALRAAEFRPDLASPPAERSLPPETTPSDG